MLSYGLSLNKEKELAQRKSLKQVEQAIVLLEKHKSVIKNPAAWLVVVLERETLKEQPRNFPIFDKISGVRAQLQEEKWLERKFGQLQRIMFLKGKPN